MKRTYIITLTTSICLSLLTLNAQDSIDDARALLDKWVETRQIISEEKEDWRVEKSILSETRTLLSNELNRLQESIEELESSATATDQERSKLAEEKEELRAAANVVATKIAELETKTKRLLPLFPDPLTETVKPLIRRLPDDPENAKATLGERVQNIVGILSQANKFNNKIQLTSETRVIEEGKEVQVNTLYWGLAMAYYVDASGEYAGVSYPTAEGWQTKLIKDAGPQIRELIDAFEGIDTDYEFVEIPAQIH